MTVEIARWTDEFEAANTELAARSERFLQGLLARGDLHIRFMNTLSRLEQMGSQRIFATQSGAAMDEETLRHLAEETRHAWFFRQQAERLAKQPLDYAASSLLAPASAAMYFKKLEATIARPQQSGLPVRGIYLYMSLVIEFRAVWFYRLYQRALSEAGIAVSLRSLLAEESSHLKGMLRALRQIDADLPRRLDAFLLTEQKLYTRLLRALEEQLDASPAETARLAAAG